jgi:hypothetical protein
MSISCLTCDFSGRRYWDRTSDLFDVKQFKHYDDQRAATGPADTSADVRIVHARTPWLSRSSSLTGPAASSVLSHFLGYCPRAPPCQPRPCHGVYGANDLGWAFSLKVGNTLVLIEIKHRGLIAVDIGPVTEHLVVGRTAIDFKHNLTEAFLDTIEGIESLPSSCVEK